MLICPKIITSTTDSGFDIPMMEVGDQSSEQFLKWAQLIHGNSHPSFASAFAATDCSFVPKMSFIWNYYNVEGLVLTIGSVSSISS